LAKTDTNLPHGKIAPRCAQPLIAGQGEKIVQACRAFMILAGPGLLLLAAGCQASGKGMASAGSGPSPTFGQKFAPPQSEPPVDSAGTGRTTAAARSSSSASADDLNGDDPSASAGRRARWLPGGGKEPERKTLPVSARTDSIADDDSDRRSEIE
jgi:hypothetical protein